MVRENVIAQLANLQTHPSVRLALEEGRIALDKRGRVIGFGGRVLGNDTPKYLNSPETDIFHKGRQLYGLYEAQQDNAEPNRLLVVEGYMDVVALAQYGINYAVASTSDITKDKCSKCLSGCKFRNNVGNFGGFLSINKLSQ